MGAVLHIISDWQRCRLPLEEALIEAALGGAAVLQVRQKKAPAADTYALATRIMAALHAKHAPSCVIVNDRMDVAVASGAAGVHLAAESIPVDAAVSLRARAGWSGLIGCSVHSGVEAAEAQRRGADYVTFGHIFATRSHAGVSPKGLPALFEIVRRLAIPVIAVGGITTANIREVLQTGCSGVAVIGAVLESDRPRHAAMALVEQLERFGDAPRVTFPQVPEREGFT